MPLRYLEPTDIEKNCSWWVDSCRFFDEHRAAASLQNPTKKARMNQPIKPLSSPSPPRTKPISPPSPPPPPTKPISPPSPSPPRPATQSPATSDLDYDIRIRRLSEVIRRLLTRVDALQMQVDTQGATITTQGAVISTLQTHVKMLLQVLTC